MYVMYPSTVQYLTHHVILVSHFTGFLPLQTTQQVRSQSRSSSQSAVTLKASNANEIVSFGLVWFGIYIHVQVEVEL
jgi:hypothetical protein